MEGARREGEVEDVRERQSDQWSEVPRAAGRLGSRAGEGLVLSREDPGSFHGDRREEGETRWERSWGDRWEKPRESPSGDLTFSGKRRPDLLCSREQSGWGSEEV